MKVGSLVVFTGDPKDCPLWPGLNNNTEYEVSELTTGLFGPLGNRPAIRLVEQPNPECRYRMEMWREVQPPIDITAWIKEDELVNT